MNRSTVLALALGAALSWVATPAAAALDLKGWLEWIHKVEMRVLENGVVEQVLVNAGQHVKQGDLLLRMDQREAKAALLGAKAKVARGRIATQAAGRELTRTKELFDRGLIAAEELKDAELKQAAAGGRPGRRRGRRGRRRGGPGAHRAARPLRRRRGGPQRLEWGRDLQDPPARAPDLHCPGRPMIARALVTAPVLRQYRLGQPARVRTQTGLREGRIHSLGVEAVRVELQGAVYYLDIMIERSPNEVLRPSETVEIQLP